MDISDFESSGMLGDVPEAFRRYLGLDPLESLVHTMGAQGATRLFTCPSFEPVEATTILYLDDTVKVSVAISDDDVWERISCGDGLSVISEPSQVFRQLAGSDLPSEFHNWERVADALRGAESCMSDNPDGMPYYHFAFGARLDMTVAWFNPTETANPRQCAIIEGYSQIKSLL
jgi:hypothetical protein